MIGWIAAKNGDTAMKTGLRGRVKITERLGFRLAFLLSVALLPLGIIALVQTWQLSREAEVGAQAALIQRTAAQVAGERALIESALGAAEALGQSLLERLDDVASCSQLLADYAERSPIYVFAGFVPTNGQMACNSAHAQRDMRGNVTYETFMAQPGPLVTANDRGSVSGEAVLIVSQPVTRDGVLMGYLALSIPHQTLDALRGNTPGENPATVVIVNQHGMPVFLDHGDLGAAPQMLPQRAQIPLTETEIFQDRDGAGQDRVFVAIPAVPGLVTVLGSWAPEQAQLGRGLISPATLLFPLTMWLTSLVVAYAAVDRLVIRHVRELRGQMRRFALGRRDTPPEVLADAPAEIVDVSQTFHNLARILIRDEAEREASLQEKTVLLKEVHHRVKNNLQLIASIMNMQIRQVREPGARRVLKSVQDRVASLATIHRNLYQAESLSAVAADRLLSDIVNQMMVISATPGSGLRIDTDFDKFVLYPDQAVPVSLLATEALTNAVKYAGPAPGEAAPWIKVSLKAVGEGLAELRVENSLGAGPTLDPKADPLLAENSSGLGSQLIQAFATQLNSEAQIETGPSRHAVVLRFELAGFDAEEPGAAMPAAAGPNLAPTAAR